MALPRPRPLVAGNWKMNGLKASAETLGAVIKGYDKRLKDKVDLLICPPATLLMAFAVACTDSGVAIGAQDCHAEVSGAFTGDVSAEMIADLGAIAVVVGHSERRHFHREGDADVRAKTMAARRAGLAPIVCIGETREERDEGITLDVIARQLDASLPDDVAADVIVAYEPVWAIGTGLTPTRQDVEEVHGFIRDRLMSRFGEVAGSVPLLYGGSVKPSNAKELLSVADVDGALVGGASLVAADFLAIAKACRG